MQKHSDEALVAYLDGELEEAAQRELEASIETDPELRDRLAALARSSDLVRSAYAHIIEEPIPERLVAAARGEMRGAAEPRRDAQILFFRRPLRTGAPAPARRQVGYAAAAALLGLMVGSAGTYLGTHVLTGANSAAERQLAAAVANTWLDNAAASYKLIVNAGDQIPMDVPASSDPREALQKISQTLPQQLRLPDLKPWGLSFRGARLVAVEGRPGVQLVYTTDNKAIGPLALVIGTTKQPDTAPAFDHRQDVNLMYWRHHGRAYALVGQADIGYLWGIVNDVAWQLNAI